MFEKRAITQVAIADSIALRWSGCAFDPGRTVERNELFALLEAARWAPSCYGDQPWRYIIWDRARDPDSWERAFDCLAEGNQAWVRNAPLLMAAMADSEFERNGKPNRWGQYDAGAASMSLCIQATTMDLMVHQMGGFDAKRLREEFEIPNRYACMAMIAIGYQLPEDRIPEELKAREYGDRERRPIGDSFCQGAWGKPFRD